jgi:hypothetical protein
MTSQANARLKVKENMNYKNIPKQRMDAELHGSKLRFESKLSVAFSPVKSWWNGLRQMRWAAPIVMVSRPVRPKAVRRLH